MHTTHTTRVQPDLQLHTDLRLRPSWDHQNPWLCRRRARRIPFVAPRVRGNRLKSHQAGTVQGTVPRCKIGSRTPDRPLRTLRVYHCATSAFATKTHLELQIHTCNLTVWVWKILRLIQLIHMSHYEYCQPLVFLPSSYRGIPQDSRLLAKTWLGHSWPKSVMLMNWGQSAL